MIIHLAIIKGIEVVLGSYTFEGTTNPSYMGFITFQSRDSFLKSQA